jgi:hypothetical protein
VVLPWNAQRILEGMDAHPGHPSQSESAGGQMPTRAVPRETWKTFRETCASLADETAPDVVRICDGRLGVASGGVPRLDNASQLAAAARERLGDGDSLSPITPSLPDCWVWMSRELFTDRGQDDPLTVAVGRQHLCKNTPAYLEGSRLNDDLLAGRLRIVTVSRARYNPRFRGRIVASPNAAKDLLLHAALCITTSTPLKHPEPVPA